ncbi:Endo-1-3(4)-beta-glucanase [Penicillium brevicompactum]|uniref:Endo-1-3(4)-beta-glucanase n=1 Tax=Penicillium brevicompactum TaxID=5074 RepID=A0A9W9Q835_PENBR|nr:Endo-1-3(4)-beta-glucanase [Penicillium brevicompactum]
MSSDDASPQAGQYSSYENSTNEPRSLPGHNPALARYNTLQLRQETVVRPDLFTMYFGFLGTANWRRKVSFAITDRVENHYVLTARSPTQSELDAIVEHGTRSLYHNRIGLPVGAIIGGSWAYYRLRTSPHFPRANPTPHAILEAMRMSSSGLTLKSFAASTGFRLLFFTCFFGTISNIYAVWNDAKNMLTDPRLKWFVEEMRNQKPEDVRKRKLQAASERVRSMRTGEPTIGVQLKQAITSPDGHAGGYDQDTNGYSTPPNSYSEYETSNSTQSSSNPPSSQSTTPTSSGPVWARGRGNQQVSEQSSGASFFDDDDASPTAAEYRNTNIDGSSRGSAWDRIRRQNAAASSQSQESAAPQSSPNPYSYESNYAEQDRYRAESKSEKDKAQAEFDKMIDAERNAGSDRSPRNRGWGS